MHAEMQGGQFTARAHDVAWGIVLVARHCNSSDTRAACEHMVPPHAQAPVRARQPSRPRRTAHKRGRDSFARLHRSAPVGKRRNHHAQVAAHA
eukprot:365940-Chlamydomonas_euryale.AAC.35